MRYFLILTAFAAMFACGSNHTNNSALDKLGPWMLQNPNFDNGLAGWTVTGNVTVVSAHGIAGITKAAMLSYDGHTATSISQEIDIPHDTYLMVNNYQACPATGWLQVAVAPTFVLDNNTIGPGNCSGSNSADTLVAGGLSRQVAAGKITIAYFIDGANLGGITDPNSTAGGPTMAGATALVTGLSLNPNAPQPAPAPCECPADWILNPTALVMTPTPAMATVTVSSSDGTGYTWVGRAPDSPSPGTTCNSTSECSQVQLGVDVGTFSVTVEAPGYQNATTSAMFTRVPGNCCPGLTPTSVAIALTPN